MNVWVQIWDFKVLLLDGFVTTLELSAAALIASTILGFLLALLRLAKIPVLSVVLRIYLEIFRGSPPLVQILFVYFGAAYLHVAAVNAVIAAFIAISLSQSALISEVFRAGFESVPVGQREAAQTLGLKWFSRNRYVVVPQAMRVVEGPLVGQWISLVKNTALASVIGIQDLLFQGQAILERGLNPFAVLAVVGVGYFLICYPLSLMARQLERRNLVRS